MCQSFLRFACVLGVLAVVISLRPCHGVDVPTGGGEAIEAVKSRAENEISVRQLNEFHLAVIGRLLERMEQIKPDLFLVTANRGVLGDNGAGWQFVETVDKQGKVARFVVGGGIRAMGGHIGQPLAWDIFQKTGDGHVGQVSLSFWISLQKTPLTVCECKLSSGKMFVNVEEEDIQQLDDPKKELGNKTSRDVLMLLEDDLSEIERPVVDDGDEK